jgi:hypothetical protein
VEYQEKSAPNARQFEVVLQDRPGEFVSVVETLIEAGVHIKSVTLTYEGAVAQGARPTAHFVVAPSDTCGDSQLRTTFETIGRTVMGRTARELNTSTREISIQRESLVGTLRAFNAAGASLCSFSYIDRGDPEPFVSVTFFQKS